MVVNVVHLSKHNIDPMKCEIMQVLAHFPGRNQFEYAWDACTAPNMTTRMSHPKVIQNVWKCPSQMSKSIRKPLKLEKKSLWLRDFFASRISHI